MNTTLKTTTIGIMAGLSLVGATFSGLSADVEQPEVISEEQVQERLADVRPMALTISDKEVRFTEEGYATLKANMVSLMENQRIDKDGKPYDFSIQEAPLVNAVLAKELQGEQQIDFKAPEYQGKETKQVIREYIINSLTN